MKRARLRRWSKWACTLAAGVAAGLAVFSAFWGIGYVSVSGDGDVYWCTSVEAGLITCYRQSDFAELGYPGGSRFWFSRTGAWHWRAYYGMFGVYNPDTWHAGVSFVWNSEQRFLGSSLAYPVVLFTIPAALLWYVDRRRFGPGQCKKCGYDRRGLAEGSKCPECGKV
jgi:hypothetical protein